RGDVCRLTTATREGPACGSAEGFASIMSGIEAWYGTRWVSTREPAQACPNARKPAPDRGGSPRAISLGRGSARARRSGGSVQPTFFAACRVASAAVSAALRTLVDAAFTWLRATFVCSIARCVYGERRM